MSTTQPDEFRELLFADVALLQGHAEARQVAAALLRYWDRRDRTDTTLASELASLAGIDKETLAKIEAEVDRMVSAASGDPRIALTQRGGLAHELHTAVSRQDGKVSRQLTEMGAGIRVALRTLPKDRYLDFMPVGEGGMGIVYWAMDTELGRQVAFKVVRPPVQTPGAGVTPPAPIRMRAPEGGSEIADAFEELKARFLQEAWVTGGMEHPGIVPVYELGQTEGGVPYYTMRFVRGRRTLEDAILEVQERPFDERTALLEPFLKICDALAYAHNRRVVHRDLKPANVALGEYGETIVLDWGLAKLAGHPDIHASRWQANVQEFRKQTDMETMESALGTPGYMAPEAASGEVDLVDQLSDIYSLGAILFEIVTGRLPFKFKTFLEYAQQVVDKDAPIASEVDGDVPPALAQLCASALSRDRSLRPATVADLAKGVRRWLQARARDREIAVLLSEAESALSTTDGMTVVSMRKQSEHAAAACQRILGWVPGNERAAELLAKARKLRDDGVRIEEQQARRTLLRRVAVGGLLVLAVLGAVVAWALENRRQEAEDAREVARTERGAAQAERDTSNRLRSEAESTMEFVVKDLFAALEPLGKLKQMAAIGERARAHYASIPAEHVSEAQFTRRTSALNQLGAVYRAQGHLEKARGVFLELERVAAAYTNRVPGSARGAFVGAQASVGTGQVDIDQGWPLRVIVPLRAVRAQFAGAAPDGFDRWDWEQLRIRAGELLGLALHGRSEFEAAYKIVTETLSLAEQARDRVGAHPDASRLAIEVAHAVARTLTRLGRHDEAIAMAKESLTQCEALIAGAQAEDLSLLALLARSEHRVGWVTWYGDKGEAAIAPLERAVRIGSDLSRRSNDNYAWARLAFASRTLLGDVRAGKGLHYFKHTELYLSVLEEGQRLYAVDKSHVSVLTALVNLCDRLANAYTHGKPKDLEKVRHYRETARDYARHLSTLEVTNPSWRYWLAFTIGTAAGMHPSREVRARQYREALGHTLFALDKLPDAHDVADFAASMAASAATNLPETEIAAALRSSMNDLLGVARRNPEGTEASWTCLPFLTYVSWARQMDEKERAAMVVELSAEILTWYDALAARQPAPTFASDLAAWREAVLHLTRAAAATLAPK